MFKMERITYGIGVILLVFNSDSFLFILIISSKKISLILLDIILIYRFLFFIGIVFFKGSQYV